jgi:hypothetical protein
VVLADGQQFLTRRSIVAAGNVTQPAIADIKALDNREAKRAGTLDDTPTHGLTQAEVAKPSRCSEVLLKKPRILAVGLPGKIKSLSNEGNAP